MENSTNSKKMVPKNLTFFGLTYFPIKNSPYQYSTLNPRP